MKTNKKFDSVKMMRDIRDQISSDINEMSSEQILDYIKKGQDEFEKKLASHQHRI